MKKLLSILLLLSYYTSNAQLSFPLEGTTPQGWRAVFSGYVKAEGFFDTRQTVAEGDHQLLLYPDKKLFDVQCKDINAHGLAGFYAIETRMRVDIYGPEFRGIKNQGIIETDFFGSDSLVNRLRMRLACVLLERGNWQILAGQYWSPVFIEDCWAHTVCFNEGAPIDPYERAPQLRLTYDLFPVRFIIAALEELQFQFESDGPDGISAFYMHRAIIPNLHGQINIAWHKHLFGAAIDYKRLVPRLVTNNNYKAEESINSFLALFFASFVWEPFTLSTKVTFMQNATDFLSFGGYAVHSINSITDHRTYTNLNAISWWADLVVKKIPTIQPGLFLGFIKNLGARETIIPDLTAPDGTVIERRVFGRGTDIAYLFRVSPRVRWYLKHFTVGAEIEYDRAAFGTLNCKGEPKNAVPVNNVRFIAACYFNF